MSDEALRVDPMMAAYRSFMRGEMSEETYLLELTYLAVGSLAARARAPEAA